MPKHNLLQIGDITPRMANRLADNFDIIEYFRSVDKKKLIAEHVKEIECILTDGHWGCLLYTSPSPRDATLSRMPSSA